MRTPLLAVLLLALTAAAAGAATLVFTPSGCTGMPLCGPEFINLHAAAGEVNRVSSAPGGAGSIIIRDDGAVITGDCERVDDHARRCPAGLFTAYLGDGDDEVSRAGTALGGDGADHATGVGSFFGEEGDDVGQVTVQGEGGPGNDRLEGPQLEGGPGDDRLEGTSLAGGPGDDLLTARNRPRSRQDRAATPSSGAPATTSSTTATSPRSPTRSTAAGAATSSPTPCGPSRCAWTSARRRARTVICSAASRARPAVSPPTS